jgi:hypothetical protein
VEVREKPSDASSLLRGAHCFAMPGSAGALPNGWALLNSLRLTSPRRGGAEESLNGAVTLPNSLSMGVQSRVAQDTTDEACRLIFCNRQQHDAVARVAVRRLIEPVIPREERQPLEAPEKRDDLSIAHSRTANLMPGL